MDYIKDPKNTNCYDTAHYQTCNYKEKIMMITGNEPEIVNEFIEILKDTKKDTKKNTKNKTEYAYRVHLITKYNKIAKFNHFFVILKTLKKNTFELCDSWEGIHTFKCRKIDVYKWLDNLYKDLKNKYLSQETIDLFTDLEYDIDEDEWRNEYPIPHKFTTFELSVEWIY